MYELEYINRWNDSNNGKEIVSIDSREKLGMIILTCLEDYGKYYPRVSCTDSEGSMYLSIDRVGYNDRYVSLLWKEI